jgi:hypothetical protein
MQCRKLLDISSITTIPVFRRLMRAACHRLGRMLDQTELSRDGALPQPTAAQIRHPSGNLLPARSHIGMRHESHEASHQDAKALLGRLRRRAAPVGFVQPGGAHLENLALNDLLAWRDASVERLDLFSWRTVTGNEVDFVIEAGGRLLPIEVKATSRPRLSDAAGLRAFRAEYGKAARTGLLLHAGQTLEWLAPNILAAPWRRVL